MTHKCDKCGCEATCYKDFFHRRDYLCDACLVKVYNQRTSENKACVMCGSFNTRRYRTIDGQWLCSLTCLKKYFGYLPIEETECDT